MGERAVAPHPNRPGNGLGGHGLGDAGREGLWDMGMDGLGNREGLEVPGRHGLGEAGSDGLGKVGMGGLVEVGGQVLGEAGRELSGGQAAARVQEGLQEGNGQAAGAVVQEGLLMAGIGDSGLKTVAQQNLAGRRHQSHQPPYQFVGRYNNDIATVCYLNGAINLLTSSVLFNDTFFVIKSGGPLINQLHLICGSYPGQVRQLYIQGVPFNWTTPKFSEYKSLYILWHLEKFHTI